MLSDNFWCISMVVCYHNKARMGFNCNRFKKLALRMFISVSNGFQHNSSKMGRQNTTCMRLWKFHSSFYRSLMTGTCQSIPYCWNAFVCWFVTYIYRFVENNVPWVMHSHMPCKVHSQRSSHKVSTWTGACFNIVSESIKGFLRLPNDTFLIRFILPL